MTVLILCAGKGERWTGVTPKQLVRIGDKPLLQRTINQVKSHTNQTPYVVTRLAILSSQIGAIPFPPKQCDYIIYTLESTRHLWKGTVTVLLGDVIFSPELMKMIFEFNNDIYFFGRDYEIYAITFPVERYADVEYFIGLTTKMISRYSLSGYKGKLWNMYYLMHDLPWNEHKVIPDPHFIKLGVDDYSRDFDMPSQYEDFVAEYNKNPELYEPK